jgi:hypothetical protein
VLEIGERHRIAVVRHRLLDAARVEIAVAAVEAQDTAHLAPILERVGHMRIVVDADTESLAVLIDGGGFDGVHGGILSC